MQRIDDPSNIASPQSPLTTVSPGYFRRPSVAAGDQGTILTADWANDVQENIVQVITSEGFTLAKGTYGLLRSAIAQMIDNDVAIETSARSNADTAHAALISSETILGHLEVATAAEATALSNNARALTPHNLTDTFEIGSNANGSYIYLPTGAASGSRYLFQWGRSASGGENRLITFPQTMATSTGYYGNGTPESQANDQGTRNYSTTQMTLTSSGYSGGWRWIVFGPSA